jgi:hypothetical protein
MKNSKQSREPLTYTHATHKCTHVICDMPWKASDGTEVIPLLLRSSIPFCVGQEPVRTSGAPAQSPLKLQPPNATVQGIEMHVTGPW